MSTHRAPSWVGSAKKLWEENMSDDTPMPEYHAAGAVKAAVAASVAEYGEILGGLRSLETEAAEFSRACLARNMAAFSQLAEAKSIGRVMEIQSKLVTTTLEALVTEGAKVREIYGEAFARCVKPWQKLAAPAQHLRHS